MKPHNVLITLGISILAFVAGVELGHRSQPAAATVPAAVPAPAPAPAQPAELIPDGPAPRGEVVEQVRLMQPVEREDAEAPPLQMPSAPEAEPAPPMPLARVVEEPTAILLERPEPRQPEPARAPRQERAGAPAKPETASQPGLLGLVTVKEKPEPMTMLTPDAPAPAVEPARPAIAAPGDVVVEELSAPPRPAPAAVANLPIATPAAGPTEVSLTPEQVYGRGYNAYEQGRYADAVAVLQQFLVDYPDSSLADNAQYWIGECYYSRREFAEAAETFALVAALYPAGDKVPDALLKEAYALFELGRPEEGRVLLQRIVAEHGASRAANLARERLARLAQ